MPPLAALSHAAGPDGPGPAAGPAPDGADVPAPPAQPFEGFAVKPMVPAGPELPDLSLPAAVQAPQGQDQGGGQGGGAVQLPAHPGPAAALPATLPVASPAAPGAPAAQLAPALVQLSHVPGGSALTLRLDPAELGHVQIRIERTADGAASVQVTAERPETLRLLMADQPQLHRALDSAGVPPDGRSLALSLATPDSGGQSPGGGGPGGQPAGGGQAGSGQAGSERQQRHPYAGPAASGRDASSPSAWLRAGVDITA